MITTLGGSAYAFSPASKERGVFLWGQCALRNCPRRAGLAPGDLVALGRYVPLWRAQGLRASHAESVSYPDLGLILRQLYASEINFTIESFCDAGWMVTLGDALNGVEAEEWFRRTTSTRCRAG